MQLNVILDLEHIAIMYNECYDPIAKIDFNIAALRYIQACCPGEPIMKYYRAYQEMRDDLNGTRRHTV